MEDGNEEDCKKLKNFTPSDGNCDVEVTYRYNACNYGTIAGIIDNSKRTRTLDPDSSISTIDLIFDSTPILPISCVYSTTEEKEIINACLSKTYTTNMSNDITMVDGTIGNTCEGSYQYEFETNEHNCDVTVTMECTTRSDGIVTNCEDVDYTIEVDNCIRDVEYVYTITNNGDVAESVVSSTRKVTIGTETTTKELVPPTFSLEPNEEKKSVLTLLV